MAYKILYIALPERIEKDVGRSFSDIYKGSGPYTQLIKLICICLGFILMTMASSLVSDLPWPDTDYNVTWYDNLKKPWYQPAPWEFIPVWFVNFTLMGISSFLVWFYGNGFDGAARKPLTIYIVQLAINSMWMTVFYGWHLLFLAMIQLWWLNILSIACICAFSKVNNIAALLLLPTLAWGIFAGIAFTNIVALNPDAWWPNDFQVKY